MDPSEGGRDPKEKERWCGIVHLLYNFATNFDDNNPLFSSFT
jgi:hypothetical protein